MRFRKKPVVIEAHQWTRDCQFTADYDRWWPSWLNDGFATGTIYRSGQKVMIKTLEGDHGVSVNDWIIRGVAGELYPCKPDIFAQTYEAADG